MDGNKDEALRCLHIAKQALASGDQTRASKFITKAKRLDPSLQINDLLPDLNSGHPGHQDNQNPHPKQSENVSGEFSGENSGQRRRNPGHGSGPGSGSGSGFYSDEQVMIVREIKRKKDYYEILGLEKSASVEDIRKAYRKLSLKVHPDKNKAPGSEDAFKKVSKAFQCLSGEESRKQYDLVGSDEPVNQPIYDRRRGNGNGFYYDGDVDAEEIFRNFFFGGMNPRATTQFTGFSFGSGGGVQGGNGSGGMRTLLQVLPVILILLLNFLPSNEPVYTFSRTYGYDHMFTTQKGVNFYVKSRDFEREYPKDSEERVNLEERIDHDYVSIISHNCRLEMQRVHWGYYQPETPNCDRLKQFEAIA